MENYEYLSSSDVEHISEYLSQDGGIPIEFEIGSPPGVFIGVTSVDEENRAGEFVAYVYVADRRAHNESDINRNSSEEPYDLLAEESEQLEDISNELRNVLSEQDISFEGDRIAFKSNKESFYDNLNTGEEALEDSVGEYYAFRFRLVEGVEKES